MIGCNSCLDFRPRTSPGELTSSGQTNSQKSPSPLCPLVQCAVLVQMIHPPLRSPLSGGPMYHAADYLPPMNNIFVLSCTSLMQSARTHHHRRSSAIVHPFHFPTFNANHFVNCLDCIKYFVHVSNIYCQAFKYFLPRSQIFFRLSKSPCMRPACVHLRPITITSSKHYLSSLPVIWRPSPVNIEEKGRDT